MITAEEQERIAERQHDIVDFLRRRDPNRVGMTSMTIYRRLAYLFTSERRCNHDLHSLLQEGRVRRVGDAWAAVDPR